MKIKIGIIGSAGYTGGELIRLLLNHPHCSIEFVHSKSNAGKYLYEIHKDLIGETNIRFSETIHNNIHVLFLCVAHGEAKKILEENKFSDQIKIIDLSQDFRLNDQNTYHKRRFIYGLPELNKKEIQSADNIANPGCFATCIQLGLLPLFKNDFSGEVYTTGITGSTGAGQNLSPTSHFSWRAGNVQAYKTLQHQHVNEIAQSLRQIHPMNQFTNGQMNFVPWRGDFTRGIYVSSVLNCDVPLNEVKTWYEEFYKNAVFIHISDQMIDLKQVVNTNKCLIHIEQHENKIVIHSAIDNLLKGASGQAVQNMNLMFGIEETTGIKLKASAF
jgi:N-acetyl-gamma-glutamyl-phosphate reductase